MANVTLDITGQIDFESNATRDQSCHIVLFTLVNSKGEVLTNRTATGCWLKALAIRPKDTEDICLPDNVNPFIFNITASTDTLDFCQTTGCDVYLRIYIIPCCRVSDSITFGFTNDPINLKYEIYDLTTDTSWCSPNAIATTSGVNTLDGYAVKDIKLNNPSLYNCNKYMKGSNATIGNAFNNFYYGTCALSQGAPSSSINNFSLPAGLPSAFTDLRLYLEYCFRPLQDDNFDLAPPNKCCNVCKNYTVGFNNTTGSDVTIFVLYQSCTNGVITTDTQTITNGTNFSQTYCAVEGSIVATVYNSTTYHGTRTESELDGTNPPSITTGSDCRTCQNYFN